MMEGKNFLKFVPAFVLGSLLFFSNCALADDYAVTPSIIDIKAQARDIIKKSVTITNDSDNKVDIYPTVNNFKVEEGGVEEFIEMGAADKSTSLANWIQFPRAVIELESGESKTIVFTIQVNLEAKPGSYHARIAFPQGSIRSEAEEKADDSPAVIINLEVTEKVNEMLELRKFLSGKTFFLNLPANFLFSIGNIGNKDVVPRGEVIVYDRKGKEVKSISVNIEGKTVSPGGTIDLESVLGEGNFFGKYKAFLSLRYGENQKGTITDTAYFYVLPWHILSALVAGFAAIVWLFSVWLHKRRGGNVLSHPGSMSHNIFHSEHPIHRSIHHTSNQGKYSGQDNRSDYYQKLEKETYHRSSGGKHSLAINGKKKIKHVNHGHVMDLRGHKKG